MNLKLKNFLSDARLNFHRRTTLRWLFIKYPYQAVPVYLLIVAGTFWYSFELIRDSEKKRISFDQKLYDPRSGLIVKEK